MVPIFLGRGVRGRGIPNRPGSTAQSLISPYSAVIYFHTYLDYEQPLFFLRPWSETHETRNDHACWLKARDRRGAKKYTPVTKSEERETARRLIRAARIAHSFYTVLRWGAEGESRPSH